MSDMSGGIIQLSCVVEELASSDRRFAQSLIDFYKTKGRLSEKQAVFIPKLIEKAQANYLKKTAPPVTQAICTRTETKVETPPENKVDNFERILNIFDTAKEKGYKKKIILRFGDEDLKVKLSEAPAHGVNAGWVYVTANDEYKGKIDRRGEWRVNGEKDEKLKGLLTEFVLDPLTTAKKFGFKTGKCCCCGRPLTDPVSIANGIGPICQEGFF